MKTENNSTAINQTYYNENAAAFAAGTVNADVSALREKFLSAVPTDGIILDWGCGSGRDTKAFLAAGYSVVATDASPELCRLASKATGIVVRNEDFSDLKERDFFDGIWACASLLHVQKDRLPSVFSLAAGALKDGGVCYASFKYGDFEGVRNGRFFTDLTESSLQEILQSVPALSLQECWITGDVREGRADEKWLNTILKDK